MLLVRVISENLIIERAYTIQNTLYRWRTALGFLVLMFVLFFVFGRLFVFNWSTFPLAASERKFLNTWTWQPYLKKLNWIRRLVLCDWNCVVTFHQRSCLIPYPIDGKVSRHQFLPHHFPGLLRVWGWTTKLLIVQSNYKFTNLFLAIQCVVLSLHTIFFLESTCEGLE